MRIIGRPTKNHKSKTQTEKDKFKHWKLKKYQNGILSYKGNTQGHGSDQSKKDMGTKAGQIKSELRDIITAAVELN